jgi:hypothetical protein
VTPPSPVPNATLRARPTSALLNIRDTGTAVGLFKFLFTSRNFSQLEKTRADITKAVNEFIKYFIFLIVENFMYNY